MYTLKIFNIFTFMQPSLQYFRMFESTPKESPNLLAVTPQSPLPQILATTNQLTVSMDLFIQDILYQWNHVICSFL